MNLEVWHIWAIVALLFGIIEIFTPSFVALSLALGCVFGALGAGFGWPTELQLLLFSVGTALSFFTVRPFMLRYAHRGNKSVKTNIDALAGKTGRVTEIIDNASNTGRIIVDGDDWRALTENNTVINVGEMVEVLKVDSTRLIVRKNQ